MTRVGAAIKLARHERGWSRRELSERSGYAYQQLECIERGRHMPKAMTLRDIADALGAEREPLAWLWVVDKYEAAIERMRDAGMWGE